MDYYCLDVWVKVLSALPNPSGTPCKFDRNDGEGSPTQTSYVTVYINGTIVITLVTDGDADGAGGTASADEWIHATLWGSAGTVRFYMNNTVVPKTLSPYRLKPYPSYHTLTGITGPDVECGPYTLWGGASSAAIPSQALVDAYQASTGTLQSLLDAVTPLRAWSCMEADVSGTLLLDKSGNNVSGTIYGSPVFLDSDPSGTYNIAVYSRRQRWLRGRGLR
jgi:hypothetical protein